MRYDVAATCRAIKILTAVVILIDAAMLIASLWVTPLAIGGALISLVIIGCYLRAPVAYHISHNGLGVEFRLGKKQFGRVISCGPVKESAGTSIRLWGNGGLFAGTGIFWNSSWGTFRAYVTTADRSTQILLDTDKGKVLVSPDDRLGFMQTAMSFVSGTSAAPIGR